MYINSITIENFRTQRDRVTFEFTDGINLIFGRNGTGKSTVLKAMRLLLLDICDATNLDEYINEHAETFNIEMDFSHNNHNYLEKYRHGLKGADIRELYIDDFDKPVYNTLATVKEALIDILDPHLGEHALAMMQDSKAIIELKPAPRLDLFKKIKNINFQKGADDLNTQIKDLKDTKIRDFDIKISVLENKEYKELDVEDLPFTEKELQVKNESVTLVSKQISDIEKDQLILDQKNIELEGLNKTKSEIEVNIETNDTNLEDKSSKRTTLTNNDIVKVKEFSDSIIKCNTDIENHIFDTTETDKQYDLDKAELEKTISDTQTEIDAIKIERIRKVDYDTQRDELISGISSCENSIALERKSIKMMEEGNCPTCGNVFKSSSIIEAKDELEKLKLDKRSYEEDLIKVDADKKEQDKELTDLETNKNRKVLLTERVTSAKSELEKFERDSSKNASEAITIFENEKGLLKELLKGKESAKKEYEDSYKKSLDEYDEDIENLEVKGRELQFDFNLRIIEIQTKEKEISEIKIDDKTSLELQITTLKQNIENYNTIFQHNVTAKKFNEDLVIEKKEDLDKKHQLEFDKRKVLEEIENKGEARTILLKSFPNFIINNTIQDMEDSMNTFVDTVYNKSLNLTLKSTATSLKFLSGSSEKRKRDVRNLSGAESFLTCLSFVDTLNQELDLGCILLDEIDQALDLANTKILFDIITSLEYKQIFLITHNKYMQDKFIEEGTKAFEFTLDGIMKV